MGVGAFSLGLPHLTSPSVMSPSTVPFRVLEPGGIRCLQPERGHHPGEGGVRWPLLGDPPGCRVPHGKGKGRGGGSSGGVGPPSPEDHAGIGQEGLALKCGGRWSPTSWPGAPGAGARLVSGSVFRGRGAEGSSPDPALSDPGDSGPAS